MSAHLDLLYRQAAQLLMRGAIWCWRRQARPSTHKMVGVPGNRDPEHICESYEPRPARLGDWRDCASDGHYLCAKCCHRDLDACEMWGEA